MESTKKQSWKSTYIGNWEFYKRVLIIVLPMIAQAAVTNAVSLVDNILVGRMGTPQVSGVSIVNQYIFIFNITVFGAVSGPSIFGAQFFGKENYEGQKHTFRFRLILCSLLVLLGIFILFNFGTDLISLYISKKDSPEMIAATLKSGKEYLAIMMIGLIPFGIGQAYSSVVRESGVTIVPMVASLTAVGLNVFLDFGLILGTMGMPKMGVRGAALATVIAKTVEALVVILWVHLIPKYSPFAVGLYKGFYIPVSLMKDMIKKGYPLLANEFLWAAGMSIIAQCYSARGLEVVAARNIASTLSNLFNVVFIQMGGCIGIIVGQTLGTGNHKKAREEDKKLLFFSVVLSSVVGMCMLPAAKYFPEIYNVSDNVKSLSAYIIIVTAFASPIWAYTNGCYFTLRSGGKTGITFLFDFVYTWVIMIPLAFGLAYGTNIDVHWIFIIVTYSELLKVIVGYYMVRSGMWINTIVD